MNSKVGSRGWRGSGVLVACLWLIQVSPALADPFFRIGEGGISWTEALRLGWVRPVDASEGLTNASMAFYDQSMGPGMYGIVTPELHGDIRVMGPGPNGPETHDSLLMSWGDVGTTDHLPVANWQFDYGIDPDLNGTLICFSLFAPPGVWDFSLELLDANGNSRGWFRGMPPNLWAEYCIDPTRGVQGIFDFFYTDPAFDLSQVIAIRLNESGRSSGWLPNPGGPNLPPYWNAWNHLEVRRIPEPSSFVLLALGIGGLAALRLRRLSLASRP
jgi:hypothetical protein